MNELFAGYNFFIWSFIEKLIDSDKKIYKCLIALKE